MASRGNPGLLPTVSAAGSCSRGGQWEWGGGTSDQQVLAKGDQDWWHLPDGAESCAGFPQKVLGPARYGAVVPHGHHGAQ